VKNSLMFAALAGGFLLVPQLASAHDGHADSYGYSTAGSRNSVYSRSYNPTYRHPCIIPSRVPSYGFNGYRGPIDSFGGYNNGYSRSRYTQSYGASRYNSQFNSHGHRAW